MIVKTAKLLHGATDLGAPQFSGDILWLTRFRAPDPFFLAEIDGTAYLFVSPLEYERAKKEAKAGDILLAERGVRSLTDFLRKKRVRRVVIPASFPYGLARSLEQLFFISVKETPFYPERLRKTAWEVGELMKSQRAAERALRRALDFLRACAIKNSIIIDGRRAVTSEHLRVMIESDLFRAGFLGVNTIVSSGIQAADPHAIGSGPIKARSPIVFDIFPVSLATHYYADMTRTVFKGEPSEEYIKMYEAVREVQEQGIAAVRAGADGADIYRGTCEYFKSAGYPTRIDVKVSEGFIHGLGHGVGTDIHEPPSLGARRQILETGNVITVEPGLYYHRARRGIPAGGIRIEDMVLVTKDGCNLITRFPKSLATAIV